MSLAEFIQAEAAGLADAAGADKTADSLRKIRTDRQAKERAELEVNTKRIFDDLKGLHARKQSLDINSPTYKQDAAAIDADIQKVGTTFHDLYHPANNPTALHHLGGFIKQHLLRQPAPPPATPAEAKESIQQMMSDLDIHAAIPAARPATPQNPLTPDEQAKAARIKAGLEPRAVAQKPAAASGVEPKTVKQTSDERKRSDFAEWKKDHPKYKGTFEEWAYQETHPAKPPKPATAAKLTPAQNAAQKDFLSADKLSNIADQVAKNPNDAVNQKRLAVALERISAGRFTTQALDYIIKAGWGNTLEQWAHNPSTGALPADVMRQLVDGAHQNLTAAKAELDKADELAPKIPKTAGEAKKSMKKVAPEDDDDKFLQKVK